MRVACNALPDATIAVNETVSIPFGHFCSSRAYFYEGNPPASCAEARLSQQAFDRLGMPLPYGTPHTDYVEGLKTALKHILTVRCAQ
ncbi:MAG: hypothetical protein V4808_07870 [Pseudomonadota bacterium]